MEKLSPCLHLGAISEKLYEKLYKYIKDNPDNNLKKNTEEKEEDITKKIVSARNFEKLCQFNYFFSLMQPAECVGILASQAVFFSIEKLQ